MEPQERNGAAEQQENAEREEKEPCSVPDFLSETQIARLVAEHDVHHMQRLMEDFLHFDDTDTNLEEAILVDYFLSGFCWGKERHFNTQQLRALMELLQFLMENIKDRRLSLQENIIEMARAMVGIGHHLPENAGNLSFFHVEQAKEIINYLKISLFQHYRLYECMFTLPREQMVVTAQQVIEVAKPVETPFPVPLEEGIPFEVFTRFLVPPEEENAKEPTQPCEDLSNDASTADCHTV